jgi:hypothetical protein
MNGNSSSTNFEPWAFWLDQAENILSHPAMSLAPQRLWQSILPGWIFAQTVNVTPQNSSAPDTERAILGKHSYGRQLGKVIDALDALIKAQSGTITEEEQRAIAEIGTLHASIEAIKDEANDDRLARIRRDLKALEAAHFRGHAEDHVARCRTSISGEGESGARAYDDRT